MKILLFLLVSISAFSQNLTIKKGEVVTITSDYQNITFNGKGKLIIDGNVSVQNMNINGNGHITVTNRGVLNLSSSINLNGDTLINNGKIRTSAVEVQGSHGYLENNGTLETTNSDVQINHHTGVIKNCGTITIKQSFNINSGRYIACNCSSVTSYNINPNGIIEGKGSLTFKQINLNKTFTNSSDIYVYYTGTVNNPNLWGKATLNPRNGCDVPLPVKLSLFKVQKGKDVEGREIIMVVTKFANFDKMQSVRIMKSNDGKKFTPISEHSREEFKLEEIKTLTILK